MKKDIILTILGLGLIFAAGFCVFMIPYWKAEERNSVEDSLIQEYLEQSSDRKEMPEINRDIGEETEEDVEYLFSDVDSASYKGEIDSILVIDEINLKKAVIRGAYNDYNLDRYFFVTADEEAQLGQDNYIIYGHCSRTYGHSFNRLEELETGDSFQLIQGNQVYHYAVSEVRRELREEAAPYLDTGRNSVQLLSCEKNKEAGYPEKRLIIVTADLIPDL